MGRRVRWDILGSFLLLSGCGAPSADPVSDHAAQVTTTAPRPFGDVPRLFSVPAGGARLLELYLPQPDGGLTVRPKLCEAAQLQALFGIPEVEPVELLSREDDAARLALKRASWEFPCTPDKPLRVASVAGTGWLVAMPSSAPVDTDGGVSAPSEVVIAIPRSCGPLIGHFRVAERAREQRTEPAVAPMRPEVLLSCRAPRPAAPTDSWSIDIVLGDDERPLVELTQGDSKVYFHRVDGRSPSADSQAVNNEVMARAASLFSVRTRREATLTPIPMPQVALDLCTESCTSFVPEHLDTAALRCTTSCAAPRWSLRERRARDGASVLDLVRADDASIRGGTFAACRAARSWPEVLGLPVQANGRDFIDEAALRYREPADAAVVPCVRENVCTVAVAANADLSAPAVLRSVRSICWTGQDTLTLRLAGDVSASSAVTLSAPAQAGTAACTSTSSSELPCSITTVRVVGDKEGTVIRAPMRMCGAAPCQSETPTLSVRGPVTLELAGLTLRPVPLPPQVDELGQAKKPVAPPLPGNRVALDVRAGAKAILRRVTIAVDKPADAAAKAADASPPVHFFAGIRVTDAALHLFRSNVHGFATAIDATRSQVVVSGEPGGEPAALTALSGVQAYGALVDLAGIPRVQVSNYAAVRLAGSKARAFVGSAELTAPVGLLYIGPGTGRSDLSMVDVRIGWDDDKCATRIFGVESRALELAGTGALDFDAVDVRGMGTVLRCIEPAVATASFRGASTFEVRDPRRDFGRCKVSLELDPVRSVCAQ